MGHLADPNCEHQLAHERHDKEEDECRRELVLPDVEGANNEDAQGGRAEAPSPLLRLHRREDLGSNRLILGESKLKPSWLETQ